MRIAIFTDFYLPSLGGVQTSILHQKKALEAAGHTVFIFAPKYSDHDDDEHHTIIRLPTSKQLSFEQHEGLVPWWWIEKDVQQELTKRQVEVVHIQSEFTIANLGVKAAKKLGLPVVYTTHTLLWYQIDKLYKTPRLLTTFTKASHWLYWRETLPNLERHTDETWSSWNWRRLIAGTVSKSDHVVSPSEHFAEKLRSWKAVKPISIIPNPVFEKLPASAPLPKTPTFIWVGRFSPEKRPLECIAATLKAMQSTETRFKLVMYGDGPLLEDCKLLASDEKDIIFKGKTSQQDVIKGLHNSSALLIGSYEFENQPMVIGEALSYGRGVVYCDPDLREGLGGGAGHLCQQDIDSMADAIKDLAQNPEKLKQMAAAARKNAPIFSHERYATEVIKVYTSVSGTTHST